MKKLFLVIGFCLFGSVHTVHTMGFGALYGLTTSALLGAAYATTENAKPLDRTLKQLCVVAGSSAVLGGMLASGLANPEAIAVPAVTGAVTGLTVAGGWILSKVIWNVPYAGH